LLGVPDEDLARSAADLVARSAGASRVGSAPLDLQKPEQIEGALARADEFLGGFDTAILTAGIYAAQEALEQDPNLVASLLQIDFASAVLFCEAARKKLLARGGGTLCAFSSVAGDRGRKPVAIYGAAKAGLSHYLESLDFRYRSQGLKTVCVKPGFVRTGMTEGLKPPPFAGEPEEVAKRVLAALERGRPVVYAPAPWRAVMFIIKRLPRFVMRRISF
ncbi:MAG: SDR family NAD(P)-dependent oxidoreductase, partial [Planctomycetes bacterium]|nr:SDR family NAD(P)-dependent oxidoreductase [Planctomycetota bacterium]